MLRFNCTKGIDSDYDEEYGGTDAEPHMGTLRIDCYTVTLSLKVNK
jgi:hypothetical protein